MLVLTRKLDETILIDGQIEIQVIRVKGNMVKLGIKAPQNVRILRSELAPFGMESEPAAESTLGAEKKTVKRRIVAQAG